MTTGTPTSWYGNNNLKLSSNALDQQTEFVYDSQQRLEKVIDALMHSSEIDYDSEHHPIRFRNGENDENNQPIESSVAYFPNGLIHTQTDARQATTTLSYDSKALLTPQKQVLTPS